MSSFTTQHENGIAILTFTPLKGMSDVVQMCLTDSDLKGLR